MDSLPARPEPSRPLGEVVRAWLHWFGLGRLAVSAFAILAVGAGGYWLLRAPPVPVEGSLPYVQAAGTSSAAGGAPRATSSSSPGTGTPTSSTPSATNAVVVYVAGAVVSPGVYEVASDARVQQAIAAAGGTTPDADLDAMNLASFVHDGDRVYVPHVGVAVPAVVGATGSAEPSSSTRVTGPVDLNHATVAELDGLPGIGPSTAAAIVTTREQKGPFSSVDDLLKVPGIGPAKVEAIRQLVKV